MRRDLEKLDDDLGQHDCSEQESDDEGAGAENSHLSTRVSEPHPGEMSQQGGGSVLIGPDSSLFDQRIPIVKPLPIGRWYYLPSALIPWL